MKKNLKLFIIMFALSVITLSVGINSVYADDVYNNYDPNASKVSCGNIANIPGVLPKTISVLYIIIQILIPILLVILGMLDLLKSITASKEDELAKARSMFFKRLVAAVLVFFVFAIVKIVVSFASKNPSNLIDCMDCFIRGNCNKSVTANNEWSCTLNGYVVTFDKAGNLKLNGEQYKNMFVTSKSSEFVPSNIGECPSESEYFVQVKSAQNGNTFIIKKK